MRSAGASKPSEKATGWPKWKVNSTNNIHFHPALGQPDVESFCVLQVGTLQPPIFFRAIPDPMYKIAVSATAAALIDDITDEVFLCAIFCGDRWGFAKFPVEE